MPQADVSINSHKITNLLDPVNPQDGATKNYVDPAIQGTPDQAGGADGDHRGVAANTYNNGPRSATLTGSSTAL